MNTNIPNISWVPGMTLYDWEKIAVLAAYRWFKGNKTQTSIALRISIKTLDTRLDEYGEQEKREEKRNKENERRDKDLKDRLYGRTTRVITEDGITDHDTHELQREASRPDRERVIKEREDRIKADFERFKEKPAQASDVETESRVRVESAQAVSEKHEMPVPQRDEVQSVLPKPTTGNSFEHRGKKLSRANG